MNAAGYAVIDLETTGIHPGTSHRIVEIAVVHVDGTGAITGSWETLLNPGRDLGQQSIHGIRAADVLAAPTFEQIAGQLIELLRGRVLTAHNAGFDCRFLQAEFSRLGVDLPPLVDGALCTMRLASEFLPGSSRALANCCAAYDIELDDAHRAAADAVATARLLGAYLREEPDAPGWTEYANHALDLPWPKVRTESVAFVPRRREGHAEPHFLERIADGMPPFAGPAKQTEYLALLDRCLLDRKLSEHEKNELVALANELNIERSACERLHHLYFEAMVRVAWEDQHLTLAEKRELKSVAALLAIGDEVLANALEGPPKAASTSETVAPAPGSFRLAPGERVVLTGETKRDRASWHAELEQIGLVPWNSVSKKVKLLVAADVDTLSGKARKAREYGIPIVDEDGLIALLRSM